MSLFVNLTKKFQLVPFPPVPLFHFLKTKQQKRPMKCEEIDMPRDGRKIVDLGEWRVEEEIAEYELEQDAEIDERVGDKIKEDVVAFEKTREPRDGRNDDRALETHQGL